MTKLNSESPLSAELAASMATFTKLTASMASFATFAASLVNSRPTWRIFGSPTKFRQHYKGVSDKSVSDKGMVIKA